MFADKLKTGLYLRLLEQGDFKILVLSGVLSALFWETIFPPAFRWLINLVWGWSTTFLRIIVTQRGEILRGAPDRGWLTVNDKSTVLMQHFSALLEHSFLHISVFYPSTHSDSNQCIRGTWGSVSCPKTEATDLHLLSYSHPTSGWGGSIYISSISK